MTEIEKTCSKPIFNPHDFLLQENEKTLIQAPNKLENDKTENNLTSLSSNENGSSETTKRDVEIEHIETSQNSDPGSTHLLTLEDLEHSQSLSNVEEILSDNKNKLPMMEWLLVQLEKILPLLIRLEQGEKLTQQEEMELMNAFSDDEVKNLYFQAATFFVGNGIAGAISIFNKEAGQLFSSLVQGVSSIAQAAERRAQKNYQMSQMDYQEIKETIQYAKQIQQKTAEAVKEANQLSFLRG